jgi:hypothetical protein
MDDLVTCELLAQKSWVYQLMFKFFFFPFNFVVLTLFFLIKKYQIGFNVMNRLLIRDKIYLFSHLGLLLIWWCLKKIGQSKPYSLQWSLPRSVKIPELPFSFYELQKMWNIQMFEGSLY